jgi:hypothetical protein
MHFENGAWVDRTVSNDTLRHIICASVSSFSPIAVFQNQSPQQQKPTLSITANSAARLYGSPDAGFSVSYSGFVNGDTPSALSGVLSCLSNSNLASPVGNYAITCSGLTSNFYSIVFVPGVLIINPAPLTVAANNFARPYGANNPPSFSGTVTGPLNNDPISATFNSPATLTSAVGSYPIIPTVVAAPNVLSNYVVTIVNGTLTITVEPTSLAVTLASSSVPIDNSTTVTVTLTAADVVIPLDPSVLSSVKVTSALLSDVLSNGGLCTLAPTATPGVASCSLTITVIEPNGRTLSANFAGSSSLGSSAGNANLVVTAPLESKMSCISSDFRKIPVSAGNYLWFNSAFKLRAPAKQKVTLTFFQSSVSFQYKDAGVNVVSVNQAMPDAEIVIDPSVTSASTSFDSAQSVWITTLPFDTDDAAFLTGLPWVVPAGGIPGDIEPVTFCGTFASDTAGVEIGWRWSAAAYSSFSEDASVLGVMPMDTDRDDSLSNHDRAGTPENFKQYAVSGARGLGGKNYTGSYSGTKEIE